MHRIRLGLALALIALLVSAGVALASVLGDTGFYKGSTSQGKPVSFRLFQNGRKIDKGSITWTADCQAAGPKAYRDVTTFSAFVSSRGVFSLAGGYDADLGNGFQGRVSANINGRFPAERRAVGTFRGRVTVSDSTGRVVDHCDSDKINWHASHR
jgi:hypothetical protein